MDQKWPKALMSGKKLARKRNSSALIPGFTQLDDYLRLVVW